ncbi:flagellar hook-length control protein FliK [Candidatus Pantoea multigeneris]|uniref:Flagellar hook-length control protein FliK n=1 Tax=Candidatus Pantoea multigeneris TaxID=2608357 RepID=A0ABX0R8T1_9GAMM|nr:flagellar hook-length control protein FliK [Pantoea multigeneris]NIF21773.1 flagellar hook-length control protein FliK [Pantoea multigeneris]
MITLPKIAITKADINLADTSDSSDAQSGVAALPTDFVTQLGNRLLSLVKQQGASAQSTDSDDKNSDNASPATQLNALIGALQDPQTLSALLNRENIKDTAKSADDTDNSESSGLSASEMQSVQALMAMLPGTAATPVETRATEASAIVTSGASPLVSKLVQSEQQQTAKERGVSQETAATSLSVKSSVSPDDTSSTPVRNDAVSTLTPTQNKDFQQTLNSLVTQSSNGNQAVKSSDSSNDSQSTAVTFSATNVVSQPLAAASNNTPATPTLNAQLGSNEWQQALSQQVVMYSRNGQQNAELRLHPEDLGSIQISLKLENDQAQLTMVSSHSHVRAALEAALPQLRTALAESGINLGQSQVSSDSFSQGQGSPQHQEARRDGQHGSFSLAQENDSATAPIAVPASLQAMVTGTGAVDIFA